MERTDERTLDDLLAGLGRDRMTDPIAPRDGTPRPWRTPRLGDSGGPVTTIVVLVIAAVAVIAGVVILRSVTGPAEGSDDVVAGPGVTAAASEPPSTTAAATTTTSTSTTTTTTLPPASKTDATVIVANASGIGGSATAMDADLDADGYTTGEVANSTGPRLDESIIYFVEDDPGALGVARLIAEQIPTANTVPMPAQPPLDRSLGDATVALLLGLDAAGRSLADLAGG
jgi:hypothetical protein